MAFVQNRRFSAGGPWARHVLAVLVISATTMLAALGFEHLGGYTPCPLCLQQRYAYYFALPAALIAWYLAGERAGLARALLLAIALGYLINAGLGVFHSGVEWGWWEGPQTCAGNVPSFQRAPTGNLSEAIKTARVIRCDQAPWRFLGLSFAGWNVAVSLLLSGLALQAARKVA